MILQCDNKGTNDLSKNWSTGGRTCHVDARMYMLQDLNEQKLMQMELGTNNLDITSHKKHTATLCRNDNDIQPISK